MLVSSATSSVADESCSCRRRFAVLSTELSNTPLTKSVSKADDILAFSHVYYSMIPTASNYWLNCMYIKRAKIAATKAANMTGHPRKRTIQHGLLSVQQYSMHLLSFLKPHFSQQRLHLKKAKHRQKPWSERVQSQHTLQRVNETRQSDKHSVQLV